MIDDGGDSEKMVATGPRRLRRLTICYGNDGGDNSAIAIAAMAVVTMAAGGDEEGHNLFLTVAEAIEGSALVLVCMTEKYKESPNCRLEGEYCNQQKKPFIPLLMQDKYRPNGW